MPTLILLFKEYWEIIVLVIAAALTAGMLHHAGYVSGKADGEKKVQLEWDVDKQARQEAFDRKQAETQATIDADRREVQERESALLKQVDDARNAGADLGKRMSNYQAALARCRAVPATAGAAASPDGAAAQPGDSGEIGRLAEEIRVTSERHYANCAADAVELAGWQVFYPNLQKNHEQP